MFEVITYTYHIKQKYAFKQESNNIINLNYYQNGDNKYMGMALYDVLNHMVQIIGVGNEMLIHFNSLEYDNFSFSIVYNVILSNC